MVTKLSEIKRTKGDEAPPPGISIKANPLENIPARSRAARNSVDVRLQDTPLNIDDDQPRRISRTRFSISGSIHTGPLSRNVDRKLSSENDQYLVSELRATIMELQKERDKLAEDFSKVQAKHEGDIRELNEVVASLRVQNASMSHELHERRTIIESLESRNNELESKIQTITESEKKMIQILTKDDMSISHKAGKRSMKTLDHIMLSKTTGDDEGISRTCISDEEAEYDIEKIKLTKTMQGMKEQDMLLRKEVKRLTTDVQTALQEKTSYLDSLVECKMDLALAQEDIENKTKALADLKKTLQQLQKDKMKLAQRLTELEVQVAEKGGKKK